MNYLAGDLKQMTGPGGEKMGGRSNPCGPEQMPAISAQCLARSEARNKVESAREDEAD